MTKCSVSMQSVCAQASDEEYRNRIKMKKKQQKSISKNGVCVCVNGTKDRTRKLVSKLYTRVSSLVFFTFSFMTWSQWFDCETIGSLCTVCCAVCRHSDFVFFLSFKNVCSTLSFSVFDDDPFHCVCRYVCLPTRLKFIKDHTPCSFFFRL